MIVSVQSAIVRATALNSCDVAANAEPWPVQQVYNFIASDCADECLIRIWAANHETISCQLLNVMRHTQLEGGVSEPDADVQRVLGVRRGTTVPAWHAWLTLHKVRHGCGWSNPARRWCQQRCKCETRQRLQPGHQLPSSCEFVLSPETGSEVLCSRCCPDEVLGAYR